VSDHRVRFVRISKFVELTGYAQKAVYHKIRRSRGQQWRPVSPGDRRGARYRHTQIPAHRP
jgi:predicted DNA-binding transcriptional regulator AlpA